MIDVLWAQNYNNYLNGNFRNNNSRRNNFRRNDRNYKNNNVDRSKFGSGFTNNDNFQRKSPEETIIMPQN